MSYTIKSSEKTKSKGSEFETKALLYLMNLREDSKDIHFFVVDFFNDVTGFDNLSNKTWDLQSKAAKKNYQSDIGKELITLYKNYSSAFQFDYYILFLGGVADSIRIDNTKNIFDINNIPFKSQEKIANALFQECKVKTYIDMSKVTLDNIKEFLKEVIFVIDDKEKSDYIRSIIHVNPTTLPSEVILEQIFNQIRDVQSSKKNNNNVEGIILNTKDEFIYHNRHLTNKEIKMMVLNRIINNDLMQKGITPSFIQIYSKFPKTQSKYMLEDCQHNVAKTLFDKNNSDNFWIAFNSIYEIIKSNKDLDIDEIYRLLNPKVLNTLVFLDILSIKYFMALIKDGIHEN